MSEFYIYWATGGSAEQPLQAPGDRALNQPRPHPSGHILQVKLREGVM